MSCRFDDIIPGESLEDLEKNHRNNYAFYHKGN